MNQSKNDYTVKTGLLAALGALWAGSPTSISPIAYEPNRSVTSEEKNVLSGAGLCDAGGQVAPGLRSALDILGAARAFTRMYISSGPNAYEYLVYFTADGRSASLINIGEEVQINSPAITDIFLEMASQNLGATVYQNASIDATLTADEALAFAGLVDLQRKIFLTSIAGEREAEPLAADPSAVSAAVTAKNGKYQWLSAVFEELLPGPSGFTPARAQSALSALAGKGLVRAAGSSWTLSDPALYFARRMLVFDTSLVVTAGYLGQSGTVSVGGFTCLQAGVRDLLFIDASGGNIAIRTISSAGVLDIVRQFLTDPSVHRKLDEAASPASQQSSGRKFCPQCGAPVQQGKKFCPQCGAKIS